MIYSLGVRMKLYELALVRKLIRRIPVILRLDGRAFHTVTNKCNKPFDELLSSTMVMTALKLCSEIQGAKCAYCQSDEISILITDFDTLTTEPWFNYNVDKIESITSGIASAYFTVHWCNDGNIAVFDSRARNYPKDEVCNYFVWRQLDWIRNSVHMAARSMFSHKELKNKKQSDMHEMMYSKGFNWADLQDKWKNGTFLYLDKDRWAIHTDVIFTKNREIVDNLLIPKED